MSGKYSAAMWDAINNAQSIEELRDALYFVCCRIQALEERICKARVPCQMLPCRATEKRDSTILPHPEESHTATLPLLMEDLRKLRDTTTNGHVIPLRRSNHIACLIQDALGCLDEALDELIDEDSASWGNSVAYPVLLLRSRKTGNPEDGEEDYKAEHGVDPTDEYVVDPNLTEITNSYLS